MLRWLVNVGFLALPIAATLGILLGIQSHRRATGQAPLFAPTLDNDWVEKTYCQKFTGISPETKGQEYTLNPNQWAWHPGDAGYLCMNITTFNNLTYPTKTSAPPFKVFWQYPQDNPSQPVHAFPNVKVDGDVLPAKLQSINHVGIDMKWTMRLDNKTDDTIDLDALKAGNVNSNVAIDMFVDKDESKAADSEHAQYEIMVWLAAIGEATHAINQDKGSIASKTVDKTTFNLFHGLNGKGQTVLTWKATEVTNDFHGDISPLIDYILQSKRSDFPSADDYMGYFSVGSEAYHSTMPVTFSVPSLSVDIKRS